MAAFYKTTLRAVPAYALLFLLLAIFGNALRIAHGHLHPTQLPILTIAIFGIGGFFVLSGNIVHPTLKMERWLSGLWLLFSVFLVLDNEIIYGQLSGAHRLLNVGLWLNAILSLYLWAAMFFADELDPYWQRWAMAALVLWLGILVVVPYASPSPNIDVFHHGLEAVNYLLDGKNPYSSPLSDLYHGAYGYIPGYIYLPVILVANTIAHLLFGDIRHTYIVSQLVVVFFLWRLGRERGLSPVASSFLALVWISFPVTLFVLEQSWNDTLLIAFCAPLAWSLNRQTINNSPKNWITTAIFLGLAVGTKQYAVVIAWVTILYVWQRFGMSTALRVAFLALAVLLATILPFFLLDPQAFIDHPILEIAGYRIRGDSMSWVAYILASSGFESFGSMILQVYLLVVGAVTLWFVHLRKVSLFHWAWAIILIYGGFFLFGKQAFCNYYYFLAFFVVLAIPFACGHVRDNGQDEKESMAVSEIGDAWVFPPTLFWSLLVLAIVLRLTFLDGIEFKQDEFNAIVLAYRHLALDGMAQVGLKSSTGLFNPPFFVYLMALPVFFTTDPASVTLFVI
ncbi:MAG TPA: hypothetical protein HPQ00_02725, partial [Magnetococcales bacterium]|nr:hypothetical protein [Magnetococcales bacterium]